MLRPIVRSLPRCSVVRANPSIILNRAVLVSHRQYADKKSPNGNPPVSDYIASQTPPSNPEIPPDRMPHQTEEDMDTEKIFGETNGTENGIPPEAVPVEEIFEKDADAKKNAPEVIKEDGTSKTNVETQDGLDESGRQQTPGHGSMPHVTEESIATERIISGENATGATDSTSGSDRKS